MIIKVIGTGCEKCDQLYQNVKEAVQALNLDAQIEKVEDLMEIVSLGVMTSPSLMVDGKLAVSGRTATVKNLMEILSNR
ncbi:thioredoxin family protein [Treponema pedis]|uniref:thioredoxin family protein n=1 Tax=Treponema pedis TaxID=409322 RepID=UPI00040B700C|nr:thioredoxin family protein [Treponema pedis]